MWSRIVDFPYKNITSQQHKYTKTYKHFLFVCVYMKNTLYSYISHVQTKYEWIILKNGKINAVSHVWTQHIAFFGKECAICKKRGKIQKTWTYIMHLQNIEHNKSINDFQTEKVWKSQIFALPVHCIDWQLSTRRCGDMMQTNSSS